MTPCRLFLVTNACVHTLPNKVANSGFHHVFVFQFFVGVSTVLNRINKPGTPIKYWPEIRYSILFLLGLESQPINHYLNAIIRPSHIR